MTGKALEPWNGKTYEVDYPYIGNPHGDKVPYTDTDNPSGMDDMEQAKLVRTALALALDRELINEQIYGGQGASAYHFFAHENTPYFQERWKTAVQYDPELAEELLDKAGYPRGPDGIRFEMPLYTPTFVTSYKELGEAVMGFWQEIGVKSEAQFGGSYAIFRPLQVSRSYPGPWMTFLGGPSAITTSYDTPKGLLNTTLVVGGSNYGSDSPFMDEKYQAMSAELDREKRIVLQTEIIDWLHDWMLSPGVVLQPNIVAYNPKVIESWPMLPDNGQFQFNNLGAITLVDR